MLMFHQLIELGILRACQNVLLLFFLSCIVSVDLRKVLIPEIFRLCHARYVITGMVSTDRMEVKAMLLADILPSVAPYSFSTLSLIHISKGQVRAEGMQQHSMPFLPF